MFSRQLFGAILSGLLCYAFTHQADLAADAALQKPIRVWLKQEPMRDALLTLSAQTGVPLSCQDALAEQKVAI
ncbi:MAG: hypothetical protein NZ556_08175, partial [Fimbriimonadales bacterium]|nr:hypothetical protein [Fimbriimonadales bacterium]